MTITRPRGEPASAGRLAARALIAHGLWILFTWSLMLIVALEPRGMQMVPPLLLAGAFLQAIVSTILVCATRRALHDFLTDTTVATWQTRALRPGRRAFDVVLSGDASQPRS